MDKSPILTKEAIQLSKKTVRTDSGLLVRRGCLW